MKLVIRRPKAKFRNPYDKRIMFLVKSLDGVTAREIAKSIDCNPTSIFRALCKLQKKHAELQSAWRAIKVPSPGGPIQESVFYWVDEVEEV